MSDTDLLILGSRRRGRPPVAEPLKPVTTWVPPAYLERLDRLALKHGVPVSRVICKLIEQALAPTRSK